MPFTQPHLKSSENPRPRVSLASKVFGILLGVPLLAIVVGALCYAALWIWRAVLGL